MTSDILGLNVSGISQGKDILGVGGKKASLLFRRGLHITQALSGHDLENPSAEGCCINLGISRQRRHR